METEKLIHFDRQEREVIEAATRSVPIGCEDDPETIAEAKRPLNGLTSGARAVALERAIAVLVQTADAIQEDLTYYRRLRDNPPPPEQLRSEGNTVAIPAIADMQQMAAVIVEARELQLPEVTEALTLLRRAERVVA